MSVARPSGWQPPARPAVIDVARTAFVLLADMAPILLRLGMHRAIPQPSTNTVAGLAAIKRSFGGALARLGIRLEVVHAERVPDHGGLVLMWNQESHLDHLLLPPAIPRPFFSLFNNAVARFPFYGAQMRASGHVHIDRTDESQWRAAVATAAERVRAGECVLVSPEGTRSWDGNLLPFKRGAFLLAIGSQCPIVCVTVIGAHARLPRGSAIVRPGVIRVVHSAPIPTTGLTEADIPALQARVAAEYERLKALHRIKSTQ